MRRAEPDNGRIAYPNAPALAEMVSSIHPSLAPLAGLLICLLAPWHGARAATSPDAPTAASAVYRIQTGEAIVEAGAEGPTTYAIVVDSVNRRGDEVAFSEQATQAGDTFSSRRTVLLDCSRKLRAVRPADAASGVRIPAAHPRAGSREARELALACAMPEGPRSRWFAGVVVSADGIVVAPHARTQGCGEISTGIGAARRRLELVANEDDITLLRIHGGGPWPAMPAARVPLTGGRHPVTLLGVSGTEPRVSAAFAEAPGSNGDDAGWPQVRTLSRRALSEGVVWDDSGTAVGLALAIGVSVDHRGQSFVRMLPASEVRVRLARHQLDWPTSPGRDVDAEGAMRRAIAATLPLVCTR